jgi:uncharacterized 2Fe-2S/4Fe-4S cluster protein (DUF4445 family)
MADVRFIDEAIPAVAGESLLDHARRTKSAFKQIASTCDGSGTCGECVVCVVDGADALCEPTSEEEAFSGIADDRYGGTFRLACRATVVDTSRDIQVATFRRDLKILTRRVELDRAALRPRVRRRDGRVLVGDAEIEVSDGGLFGVALDVGTTTIVAELVDLETGETRAQASFENPQRFGGSNVINRISYERDHRGLLQRVLIGHLNRTLGELPCGRHEIFEIVVAGNPTMRDLFFGFDVQPLGTSPFLSITETERTTGARESTALDVSAGDIGLEIHQEARVYGLPLVACHVGADAAAGMLVSGMWSAKEPVLFMDIGTNTEVLLGNRDRILAASSPAGPAFEGAGVTFGMPGMEGAIESVRLEDGSAAWQTIGDVAPRGICGSGLVDLLGELVRTGRVNSFGRLRDGTGSMVVAPEHGITFSDRDIAEIAQAKGSNFAAQMILMKLFGVGADGVGALYLAGGFAEYLDVEQAQRIGMIASVPGARVAKLGNASLEGARALLCDVALRSELERRVRGVEHVRLEKDPDFLDLFVEGMRFQVGDES